MNSPFPLRGIYTSDKKMHIQYMYQYICMYSTENWNLRGKSKNRYPLYWNLLVYVFSVSCVFRMSTAKKSTPIWPDMWPCLSLDPVPSLGFQKPFYSVYALYITVSFEIISWLFNSSKSSMYIVIVSLMYMLGKGYYTNFPQTVFLLILLLTWYSECDLGLKRCHLWNLMNMHENH